MRTTVVTGLLGSGKTTFIKNLLQGASEKTVVLVNDFGAAGIDGEIFTASGIESVELPSGCVCCTLRFDLITTIQKIVGQFSPLHLVIEPSGVASPTGVLEALESAGITRVSVVGIVDVTEFAELFESGMYGSFFEDQITKADVILVNKTDLAGEEKIAEAVRLIGTINSRAVLFRTRDAEIDELSRSLPEKRRRFQGTAASVNNFHAHFNFETLSFEVKQDMNFDVLRHVLEDLGSGKYGRVVRSKALIKTNKGSFRFDVVFGKVNWTLFEKNVEKGRLVVIGSDLDAGGIERAFR
jgi:G3E family GTPase